MKKLIIQCQDQFGNWRHFITMYHQLFNFRKAVKRASNQYRRYEFVDDHDHLIDIITP